MDHDGRPPAAPQGLAKARPHRAELVAGLVTLVEWILLFLAISGRVSLVRSSERAVAVAALVSTVVTFVVSSRRHEVGPQPRSLAGRAIVWAVILAALAGITGLVILAVSLDGGTF